jgi:hypothetical protein
MLASCPKCGENSEAKLDYKNKDIEKSKVICLGCDTVLDINIFVKRMMLQRNDVLDRRDLRIPPGGILYTCDNIKCKKQFSAEVKKKDNKVYCPHCKTASNMSAMAIALLKENKVYVGYTEAHFNNDKENNSESKAIEEAIAGSDASGGPMKVEIRHLDGVEAKKGPGRPKSPVAKKN